VPFLDAGSAFVSQYNHYRKPITHSISTEDVLNAVYTALNAPIHSFDTSSHIAPPAKPGSSGTNDANTIEATRSPPITHLSTLRDGCYMWVGLRRDRRELVDGPAVRGLVNGEVDGGTWWLVLRKSSARRGGS
jgi:hypothetical protein